MRVAGYVQTAGLALCVAASAVASRAEAAEAALTGAWVQQGTQCEQVFSRSGKALAFKKPVNAFAPAFIISGNRVRTPQASCRIKAVKPVGDRRILTLACATSVAVDDATAILAPSADGALHRYFDDEDKVGSSYKRCDS
jgi:hypothetical protein